MDFITDFLAGVRVKQVYSDRKENLDGIDNKLSYRMTDTNASFRSGILEKPSDPISKFWSLNCKIRGQIE